MYVHFSRVPRGAGPVLPVVAARTPDELRVGLSGRRVLPSNQGMALLFAEEGERAIWMRDTHVPLDIAFVDARGVVTRVVHRAPTDSDTLYRARALYVVEVPSPWMALHGITPGCVAHLG